MLGQLREITELDKYSGDCYIVASGSSVGFFGKHFFDDKFVLGINHVAKHIKCDIVIAKEKPNRFGDEIIVVSGKKCGGYKQPNNTEGDYYFKHLSNFHAKIIFPDDKDFIIVSWSTITSAMHLASYLGFKNIFLCGHDCGKINGLSNFSGYCEKNVQNKTYDNWIKRIEPQTIKARDWLEEKYNVNICSLNPFVSLNLEGNKYE